MADFGGSKGRIEDRDDEAPCFSFEFFDRDPLHVVEHGSMSLLSEPLLPPARPLSEPETMENLLRQALSKTTPTEVCFVHFPPEEITHLRAIGTESIGAIFSLDKIKLRCILQECVSVHIMSPVFAWTLSIVPCAQRDIFSIAVQSARRHTRQDSVIATYVPAEAEFTVGMTVVHFFSQEEANVFIGSCVS